MTAKNTPTREELLAHCDEIHAEDGVDPRELIRKGRPRQDDRKARQLCRQVFETLSLVLSGDCGDDVLQSLQILAVEPAPDATQLMVTVQASLLEEAIPPGIIQTSLAQVMGKLRCEVAAAITRKRAPTLIFRIV